jgi:hypothetical protein
MSTAINTPTVSPTLDKNVNDHKNSQQSSAQSSIVNLNISKCMDSHCKCLCRLVATELEFPGATYAECLLKANLMTLYERRTVLCKHLFSKMLEPTHKLNALVPPKNLQTYDLRSYSNLLVPRCRTERFSNSFIPAASCAYNNK